MERILGKNNLLSIFVPLMGAIVTAIIGALFFRPQELWNYNLVSRFEGIGFLFVAPFIFFMVCYLAALVPYWSSKEEETFFPLLLATSARTYYHFIVCACHIFYSETKTEFPSSGNAFGSRSMGEGEFGSILFSSGESGEGHENNSSRYWQYYRCSSVTP